MRSLNFIILVKVVIILGLISNCMGQETPETDCAEATGATDCDSATTDLECDPVSKKCRCEKHLVSYFDYFDGRCYRKNGADCDLAEMQCTLNSNCNSICTCLPGFESTSSQKCALSFNSLCNLGSDCDRDAFLDCLASTPNPKCQCQPGSTFDPTLKKCITHIDSACTTDHLTAPCPTHAECTGGTCKSDSGFNHNGKNQCKGDNDAPCASNADCDEKKYLVCGSSRKCKCDQGSVYHDIKETCTINAGQLCEDSGGQVTSQPCVDNARCKLVTSGGGANRHYCMCDDGLTQSAGHQCYRQFGQTCNGNNWKCNEEKFHECDGTGHCNCINPTTTWPDPTNHYCYLKEGQTCTVDPATIQYCAPHSHCKVELPVIIGECKCDGNMTPNDGLCVASHDEHCTPSSDNCDRTKFLECDPRTSHCACADPTNNLWEETASTSTCKRRANAECKQDSGSQDCVDNSDCQLNLSLLRYECKCHDTVPGRFVASTFGKCVHPYNYPNCERPYDLCNHEGNQVCQGVHCLCTDPLHMSLGSDGNCHITINSPCVLDGVDCLENMTCIDNKCQCDSSQGFVDNGKGGCDKMHGSQCSDGGGGCNWDEYLICKDGRCVCDPNYSKVFTGAGNLTVKCLGNYGASCRTYPDDCNEAASLRCVNSLCGCIIADEQTYDPVSKKCYVNLQGRCYLDTPPPGEYPFFCDPSKYVCKEAADVSHPLMGRCVCDSKQSSLGKCPADIVRPMGQIHFVFALGVFLFIKLFCST